jgi:hypothetical protein
VTSLMLAHTLQYSPSFLSSPGLQVVVLMYCRHRAFHYCGLVLGAWPKTPSHSQCLNWQQRLEFDMGF